MYNVIIYLIQVGVAIASLFSDKVRKMWRGEQESFHILREKINPADRYIWFHAASLGEFEQGRPLMEEVRRQHPEYKILLTFFSPSGYEVRKDYKGADVICYLPIDTIGNARKFLRIVRPVMAFFIKYEFWYNYFHILQHRGVQNEESQRLLASIGITDVDVVGDTRFDRVLQIKEAARRLPIIDAFVGGDADVKAPVFVAGSSWQPDEEIFIPYFNEHRQWKLIIAPHVIGEDHLRQITDMLQMKTVRYTQTTEQEAAEADCLIIDCFGLLSSAYHYGDVAYVGGYARHLRSQQPALQRGAGLEARRGRL